MNKIIVGIIAVLFIMSGALILYGRNTTPVLQPSSSASPMNNAAAVIVPTVSGSPESSLPAIHVKEFTITGKDYSFSPSTISVQQGDKVKIIFINNEGFHDFKIDEFGMVTKRIKGGEQDIVEFTADKKGTFEYYCSVGRHRDMGMKGILVIE